MVIFGRLVFYLFGRLVNNSAVRFSIYSAVWIRPYVEVRKLPPETDPDYKQWVSMLLELNARLKNSDLKPGLVWILNGQKGVGLQMVRFSNEI